MRTWRTSSAARNHHPGGLGADRDRRRGDHEPARRAADRLGGDAAARLREHWLIGECVVVGDQRPYVTALVTLDPAAFGRWKQRLGKPATATAGDLSEAPDLLAAVQQAVDRANAAVSRAESIRRFRILDADFAVGAELTSTHKVRRHYVAGKYAADIDARYA